MSKQKIEEIIPGLIRQISSGVGVSVPEVAKTYNVSVDGVKKRLRDVRNKFYKNYFDYDGKSRKWVVYPEHLGFLQKELLEPEEAVVLTAVYRNRNSLGKTLAPVHEKIVDNYAEQAKSYIFKQHISEEITEKMKQTFAVIKNAVNNKNAVSFEYNGKSRKIYPYRIVYIEYYWYLICSENGKIKSFRLSLIKKPKILEEHYEYDFETVDERLQIAMNAYVDYQEPYKYIGVYVNEELVNHIEIAAYFKAWKKLNETTVINGKKYQRFEVKTTNPDYKDIIPTILKYMPNIIVDEPYELIQKLQTIIKEFRDIYKS